MLESSRDRSSRHLIQPHQAPVRVDDQQRIRHVGQDRLELRHAPPHLRADALRVVQPGDHDGRLIRQLLQPLHLLRLVGVDLIRLDAHQADDVLAHFQGHRDG